MQLRRHILSIFGAGLLFVAPMFGQRTSGSISGQVTDASGAAIPNATVTLVNKSLGTNRTVTSNGQGEYTFDDVQIGTYEVDVTAASFQNYVATGVVVNVATATRTDAHLAAGGSNETVTVSADQIQVQTESGSLGNIVDGTQVKELPLNGRSFVELTQLGPGVSAANNFDSKNKGLQGGVDFSVNGNPTTNNLFLVDGANDNDVGSNRTILIYPSIESIAEFKMLTNSYGPEYGQASGAVITIATRSGTNTFHGSAFYEGRNDALAAYTYFARHNAGTGQPLNGKDKLRRNDWGYSIGGPIKKDKLFFFFNEEWNHEIRGFTQSACVATAAERAGDFSQAAGVLASGQVVMDCNEPQPTFPTSIAASGNAHKLASIDPSGALLPQYYPLPNETPTALGGNNWSESLPTFLKYRQENVRGDYNISKRNVLMGRYTQDHWSNPSYNGNQYWGDSPFPVINGSWSQPSKMAIGRVTSTISDSLVNDAEFAYSNNRINITSGGTDPGLEAQMTTAFPTLYPEADKHASESTPQIWNGLGNYGSNQTIQSIAPWSNSLDIYTVRDDVSKVKGRHAIKFGVFLGFNGKNEDTNTSSSERLTFATADYQVYTTGGGVRTGNNLANVLIPGNPFTLSETSTNVRAQLRWRDYEFYAGDTWKATPRVTVNYGARYSLLRNPVQPNNQITNFVPSLYDPTLPAGDACNGLIHAPGTNPCGAANAQFGTAYTSGGVGPNSSLQPENNHMIAPRVGIAWDVFGNGQTAIRLGGGQFYQRERVSRYTLVANAPFAVSVSNVPRTLGGATPPAGSLAAAASPDGGYILSSTRPNSWQWNGTVEQTLAKNTVLQVSYVGNRGLHLTSSYDVNAIQPANWLAASFASNTQQYRPFANDGSLQYWTHQGDSYYDALQSLFRTQVRQFRFQAAYTWSHAIADILTDDSSGGSGAADFTVGSDPRLDRGSSATNRPNIFVANATYFAPKLQGRNFIEHGVLGGWEITGITNADSGNSFTVYQNGVSENSALVSSGSPTTAGALNALFQTGLTGNQRPLITPGQTCTNTGINGSQIINPNAFTLVGYVIGNYSTATEPRGYCRGPKLINTDLSLDKNWQVRERINIKFRFDAFDLLNHANFRADQGNFTVASNVNCGQSFSENVNGTIATRYNACSPTNNVISAFTPGQNFGQSTGLVGNAERQFLYSLHIDF